jgi:uncharacterized protein (UPF0332 family)
MILSETDKRQLIRHHVTKAEETVKDVEFLIKNRKYLLAMNRIYYGIYYMLSALALKHDFTTSKHTQLIGWFNKSFTKDNKIDKRFSKYIQEAFEKRVNLPSKTLI